MFSRMLPGAYSYTLAAILFQVLVDILSVTLFWRTHAKFS